MTCLTFFFNVDLTGYTSLYVTVATAVMVVQLIEAPDKWGE